jgi:ACS family hexuronate transporter-like MFS transporter
MSVSYIDRQTLAAIAPAVTKALSLSNTQYGLLLSAFSMAYLVGAPTAGAFVDKVGARWGFAGAVVVWSLVAGFHSLAASFEMLFVLRILLGLAESPSFPAASQTIRRAMPGARRALAFGVLFTGSSIGAIVAAKLATSIEGAYGYRGAFLGTALIGTMWIPLWLLVTRGAGLEVAVAAQPTTSTPPVPWLSVVSSPPVLRAVVAIVGSAPAIMFVLNWVSKYLVDGCHLDPKTIGNYLIAGPLLFDVGAIGFGWIASTRERDPAAEPRTHVDLFLVAMVLSATLALVPLTNGPAQAVALFAVSACGGGGLYALVTADMLSRVPVDRTSAAGGMTAGAQSLAHIIASPLVGWAIDRTHGYAAPLVGLGVVVIPTTIAFVAWPVAVSKRAEKG